jgi:photosystem I 4.8kDa protein
MQVINPNFYFQTQIFLTSFAKDGGYLVFLKKSLSLLQGENTMAKAGADVAQSGAKSPYPFRTLVSAILLAVNFLVAAMYFKVINP